MKEVKISWNGTHWVADKGSGRVSGRLDLVISSCVREGLIPKIEIPIVNE